MVGVTLRTTILFLILYPFVYSKTIQTRLGSITGKQFQKGAEIIYQFRGIPYAKPPVGSLRFQKPKPYGSWNGTLNATKFPPSCMQNTNILFVVLENRDVSEDCLFLNVYIPREINATDRKPVMIWIHGGLFISGQASFYDAGDLAMQGNVIVVTVNYRLGIFGFISSGDALLPGNYGLWDQRLAIQWVKNNIASFGGDPSSITLFGHSSGAMSVNMHALSPINRGLFKRVIIQSGPALSKGSFVRSGNLGAFGNLLQCNKTSIVDVVDVLECIKKKSSKELLRASTTLSNPTSIADIFKIWLGFSVDGQFILDYPEKLLSDTTSASYKFFRSLDIMVGTTSGEGSVFGSYTKSLKLDISDGINTTILCDHFSPAITKEFYNNISFLSEVICDSYKVAYGDTTMKEQQGRKVVDMLGDFIFVSPSIELLNIHSETNTLTTSYQYSFERSLFSIAPMPLWFKGSQHSADIPFLFGLEQSARILFINLEDSDHNLSRDMLIYWTNFAKTGNPNSDNDSSLVYWPVYNTSHKYYLELNMRSAYKSNLYSDRMEVWLQKLPDIFNPIVRTTSGLVKGITLQYSKGTVSQFRGIPYAKAPVGYLRFRKPEPVDIWNVTLDATRYRQACMQNNPAMIRQMSENCLFLNIYMPRLISQSNHMAVMVWIHGGSYILGEGALHDGSNLALKGEVIVVTLNYRLGVFGFLTSGDSFLKGNYGLWDQRLAFSWLKNNIAAFGGDPKTITIFGESSGAFSVALHSTSTLNKGLFRRIIAQSGTSLSPFALSKTSKNLVTHYAKHLNCTNTNSAEMVNCLRKISAEEILKSTKYVEMQFGTSPISFDFIFKPTVDGEIIQNDPYMLIKNRATDSYKFFKSLDMIAGTTSSEGSIGLRRISMVQRSFNFSMQDGIPRTFICNSLVPAIISALNLNIESASSDICNKYHVNWSTRNSSLAENGRQTINLFGDGMFVSSTTEFLKRHSKQNYQSNSYQFLFSRPLPTQLENSQLPPWFTGSSHASLSKYLFQGDQPHFGESDKMLSEDLMKYWSNFAKTGNPNGNRLPEWKDFGYASRNLYLDFGSDSKLRLKEMLWPDRMQFWFRLKVMPYVEQQEPISFGTSLTFLSTFRVLSILFVVQILCSIYM